MSTRIRHAGFQGYLLRARLEPGAERADGAIAIVFDGNLRVLIHPAGRGDLVFESPIAPLPLSRAQADRLLEQAAQHAAQRPPTDADCLVLCGEPEQLQLQQRVASDASSDEFETGLGHFLNALTRWRARAGSL